MRNLSITRACFGLLSLAAAITSGLVPATGQEPYPSRHVRIITTAGTGTSPDVVVRIIAEQLSRDWGQQVVVENNGTGGGLVAAQQAAAAAPDGYTLLLASASAFTVLPIRHEHAPTVVGRDLKPIAFLGELPMAYAVSAKLGVRSVKELIELSKREPEKIFYAANATGTLPHMAGEHFKSRAGASLTFVPYRGTADALAGVLSGQIDAIVENYVTLAGTIQSGDLVLLAFSSKDRLPNFPDVPTVGETLPGFVAIGWAALSAPASVSDAIVEKINADVRRIFDKPDVRQRLIDLGNYPASMSTTELARFIRQEQEQWSPVVRSILAQAAAAQSRDKR